MALIKIKNLVLKTIIGINDYERVNKQDVILSITFEYDTTRAVQTDCIDHAVDYNSMTEKIIYAVEKSSFNLIETLADMVLKIVVEDKRVRRARVELDKPHSLKSAESIAVMVKQDRL